MVKILLPLPNPSTTPAMWLLNYLGTTWCQILVHQRPNMDIEEMWKVGWPYLAGPWHMTQNGTQATHWSLSTTWFQDHNNLSHLLLVLSVGKTLKVTPGTPDVKSRHTRCQKKLWLQLICCTPFRLLFQDFRMEVGGRIRDVLGVRRRSKVELIQYLN